MNDSLPLDLKSLTSMRFFAAFWVFLFHLQTCIENETSRVWDIVENGARGVDFFFILSGFVIFHVYADQIARGHFSLIKYMQKRFARVYPLHLVTLCIFLALTVLRGEDTNGFFASLTLLHGWHLTDGLVFNGPSWTLSAEVFAYVLFGVIVTRVPSTAILAAACVGFAVIAHAVAIQQGKTAFLHLTWDFGTIRILPLFVLGMLLRRLMPFVSSAGGYFLGILGITSFAWLAGRNTAGYEILLPFCCLVIAGARLSDVGLLPTNSKLMVYLGEISYSTYMIHVLAIILWFDVLPKAGMQELPWSFLCLVVLICSAASYHLVEVPARRYINRFDIGTQPPAR